MCLLSAMFLLICKPFTIRFMLVSATTNRTFNVACVTCIYGFFKCSLNAVSLKQLHVKMSREHQANIIHDLRFRIYSNHNWNVAIKENVPYFFGMTCRYESQLDTMVCFWTHEFFKSRLIKSISNSNGTLFELEKEFLLLFVKISMTRNMYNFWFLGYHLFQTFKSDC
jgi:hypothetical protein